MNRTLFKYTFFIFILIGVLDFLGTRLYFYWTISWFDNIMHFLAGVCAGMASILVWNIKNKEISLRKALIVGLIAVITIGVLWEFYEFFFGITSPSDGLAYYQDTASDIFLDTLGGFLGLTYAYRLIKGKA